jgi:hypothetical protein
MANSFFRVLDEEEEQEFRASARENYELGSEVKGLWHPAYRTECEQMNLEDNRVIGQPE